MSRRLIAAVLFFALVFVSGDLGLPCGAVAQEDVASKAVDDAFRTAMDKRRTLDEVEDRLAVTKEFLVEYPESRYTGSLLSDVVYYQGERLEDMPGAIAYAEKVRGSIEGADVALDIDKRMIDMYGIALMKEKMLRLAERMDSEGTLLFSEHWDVIEHAVKLEDWRLVRSYCRKADRYATGEAFRSEWSEYEFTDEEVESAAKNRKGMLLTKDAWGRANMGELIEALAEFSEAEKLVRVSYLEIPEYDLNSHWANTLMMEGSYEAAIDKFAADALILGDEDAAAGLKEAYIELQGGDGGFDEFVVKLRHSVAKTIDDFALVDFSDEKREFSKLRGKVTLLTFWFPT